MKTNENLKKIVKSKYSLIAKQSNTVSCCSTSGCGCEQPDNILTKNYSGLKGYVPDADLKLGCGIPTEYAGISTGDSVLDLGSGAGNDCFVARALVGETGKVTGLDFTDEMIRKALNNNEKLGYTNVEFIKGDIEAMPLNNNSFDVIVSNCVLNLVPDKEKAFSEMYRVLKPGGHFCVSDIVLEGELPPAIKKSAEMYAGCVAGALQKDYYLGIALKIGFTNIKVHQQFEVPLPDEELRNYLSKEEIEKYKDSNSGIYSITVSGYKL